MVDSIVADSASLASLYAFATHSYNYCMTKQMRDKVAPYGKMYWQTEASSGDPEDFANAPEAVKAVARALSDCNLGVNVWLWFIAYDKFKPESNTPRLIGFDAQTGIFQPFLKYYYFKQLSRAFGYETIFRLSTSSLSYEKDVQYGLDRFKYMENKVFQKPPVCAAAGVNADSTWAVGIANQTGIISHWDKAFYSDATTYDATIYIEELKDSGAIDFYVYRSNAAAQDYCADTLTVSAGRVTVTVSPHELVTLRTDHRYAGRTGIAHRRHAQKGAAGFLTIKRPSRAPDRYISIEYGVPLSAGIAAVRLCIYDITGRKAATIVAGVQKPGRYAVGWNAGRGAASSGVYILRLTAGAHRISCPLILKR
jgi:hypothetical protein